VNAATSTQKSHIDILKLGVSEWNKWRVERTNIAPDLKGADLRNAALAGADLRAVNLKGADLRGANLRGANLKAADLRAANLKGAILWSASLTGADLRDADLTGADLRGVNFRAANLGNAILVGVSANDYTDFRHATVTGARLWEHGEPVAEDLKAEVAKVTEQYTSRVSVKIEFKEHVPAIDCAAVLSMLGDGFFEYEQSFIESLREMAGHSLADACMHRLMTERNRIVLLAGFDIASQSIEAIAAPMGFRILCSAVLTDFEDVWKQLTVNGDTKNALIHRAGLAADELQKILRTTVQSYKELGRFNVFVKAFPVPQKAPEIRIGLALRQEAAK
jgi:hypothetical protein